MSFAAYSWRRSTSCALSCVRELAEQAYPTINTDSHEGIQWKSDFSIIISPHKGESMKATRSLRLVTASFLLVGAALAQTRQIKFGQIITDSSLSWPGDLGFFIFYGYLPPNNIVAAKFNGLAVFHNKVQVNDYVITKSRPACRTAMGRSGGCVTTPGLAAIIAARNLCQFDLARGGCQRL